MEADMLVTVLMPAYNSVQHVKAAALSILHQTHRELELIAIDDGSTDGTTQVLEEIAASDPRVRLVLRENRGLVATLNEGLDVANGELVARMDSDDIAYPDRIATQVEVFAQEKNLCLLGMGADYLYPDGYYVQSATHSRSAVEIRIESMFHCMFIHPTVMLNNKIVQERNVRYSIHNPLNEDHELWGRLAAGNKTKIISNVGLAWRQHRESVRTRHFKAQILASLDLVQRDLTNNGVNVDISSLHSIILQPRRLSLPQRTQLQELLAALWEYRSRSSCPPAYERGVSHFLANLLEAALQFGNASDLASVVDGMGLGCLIGRRHRLAITLSSAMGNSLSKFAMTRLRSLGRRARCRHIKNAPLPYPVLDCI
jgi:glycosyltransferase involved in cell wall biosynthesis